MRWYIADYIFCDQQQCLIVNEQQQQIEPMLVELLRYFCLHAGELVSKEQLIEHVWLGRIVSDNAVSKAITKLRKVLNDDARKPLFIATFPKKGYKFIAKVSVTDDATSLISNKTMSSKGSEELKHTNLENTPNKAVVETPVKSSPLIHQVAKVCVVVALLVSMFMVIELWRSDEKAPDQKQAMLTHAKALTTGSSDEYLPDVSPDGQYIAYMERKDGLIRLIVKNLITQKKYRIAHEEGVGVGPASWSDDGKFIAYLVATPERCQYFVRPIEGLSVGEAKLIHNCPAGSYGKIIFTHDNHRLIYAETTGGNSPYTMFEIDIEAQTKKRLNQPELVLGGNSQFDLHPTENKLLISSPDKQQWEGFFSLNLETDELSLLFKQNAYICCGIWDHSGNRVVLMGENPAYQLLSYDLQGHDMQIIYSGSRELQRPIRHRNGRDYLFNAGLANSDIALVDLNSNARVPIADSTVDDRLATFAHHNDQIAYVTLATGSEEIWLTDNKHTQQTKLTNFQDSRHYVDLKWSPKGTHLLALTLNEIHVVNAKTGEYRALKIPQTEIRAVSFKNNDTIAYSINRDGRWQVQFYHLSSDTVKSPNAKWQYVQFHPTQSNILWLDQAGRLFEGLAQSAVDISAVAKVEFLYGRIFNLKKRGDNWYWYDNQSRNFHAFSSANLTTEKLSSSKRGAFDIKEQRLMFGDVLPSNIDIYMTEGIVKN